MNYSKKYKKLIYSLCRRASRGSISSLNRLQIEIDTNSLAMWAVKHWKRINEQKSKNLKGPRVKGSLTKLATGNYGGRPYQGGSPGLGRRG